MRLRKLCSRCPTARVGEETNLGAILHARKLSLIRALNSFADHIFTRVLVGSARVSRVGDGVSPSRTFFHQAYMKKPVSDAETNTRDACATRERLADHRESVFRVDSGHQQPGLGMRLAAAVPDANSLVRPAAHIF